MGRYTFYKLTVSSNQGVIEELRNENNYAWHAVHEDGSTADEGVWKSHEEDLKKFSVKYPKVLFTLSCENEDSDEVLWCLYVKNGKSQREESKTVIKKHSPKKYNPKKLK